MKILKHPVFYVSVLITTIIYIAQHLQLPFPDWMYNYVNDFLCMPIVFNLEFGAVKTLQKNGRLICSVASCFSANNPFRYIFRMVFAKN